MSPRVARLRTACSPRGPVFCLTFILIGVMWLCLPSRCLAQQVLHWKLQPGQVILVDFQQDTSTQQVALGQELKSQAKMTMRMKWQVQSVSPEGEAEVAQTVENIAIDMASPDGTRVQVDTAAQTESTGLAQSLRESVQPVVGLTILQRMNPLGEILDVKLAPESRSRLEGHADRAGVAHLLSEEELRGLLTQSAAVLPRHPVRPGESWQTTSKTSSPLGELSTTMRYTYRGTMPHGQRPLDRIDVQVEVHLPESRHSPLAVTLNDQQSGGTLWFDSQAGMFVQSVVQQGMTIRTQMGQAVQEYKLNTQMQIDFRPHSSLARTPAGVSGG